MIERKSWKQFRSTGLLCFINGILHAFGWCVVFNIDDKGKIIDVFPARTKYRGFGKKEQDESHKKIANYLSKESHKFPKEIE